MADISIERRPLTVQGQIQRVVWDADGPVGFGELKDRIEADISHERLGYFTSQMAGDQIAEANPQERTDGKSAVEFVPRGWEPDWDDMPMIHTVTIAL